MEIGNNFPHYYPEGCPPDPKLKIIEKLFNRFNLSTNRRKVFRNIYWAVIGKVVNILAGLLVGILVARYLGPEQYGLMSYVICYVTLFSILATFGFDNIEIRELAKKSYPKEQILGTALYLRLFFAIVTILLIIITLVAFEPDRITFWMIIVYSLSLLFNTLNIIRNYFTAIVLNEYVVKTEITSTIIGTSIKGGLLFIKAPLEWFIIASAFDFSIIAGGYLYSYWKIVGAIKKWSFSKEIAFYQIKESFPLLLSSAAIIIYQQIDQVMIRNMIDNKALGQFAVASKLTAFVLFLPNVIAQTVTPLLIQAYQTNSSEYEKKRKLFMDMMVWGSILMALILSFCARWIIPFLFGKEYFAAIPVLQIMAWKAVGMSLSSASGQLIIIEGLQKYAVIRNFVGLVVCIILNLLLIPRWGIIGSAWATIATVAFSGYFSNYFIVPYRKIFKVQSISIISGWKSIKNLNIIRHVNI